MIISKKELLDVTGLFKSVVKSRPTMAILQMVNFRVSDGSLEIQGTDLDTFIRYKRPIKGAETGEGAVDLRSLEKAARVAPDEVEIKISSDGFTVGGIEIPASSSEDFPLFPETEPESGVCRVHTADLHEAMRRVLQFRGNDYRPVMKHVLWESSGEGLSFVCSDGRRLSAAIVACSGLEKTESVKRLGIVRDKACEVLNKAYKVSETLDFEWRKASSSEQQFLTCRFGKWQMDSMLVEGEYPDWRYILPDAGLKASVDVKSLERGARAVMAAGDAAGMYESPVFLSLRKGALSVASDDTAIKAPGLELPCGYEGGPFKVAFNSKYLADALKLLPTGQVDLFLGNKRSPGIFAEQDWLCVLMPMDIKGIEYPSYPESDTEPIPRLTPAPAGKSRPKRKRKIAGSSKGSNLLARIKKLEEENRVLKDKIHSLVKVKERQQIPLRILPEGKAVASIGSKKIALFKGNIYSLESDETLGRYDKATGLGLFEDQPVWIRKNSRRWVLQTLDAVHEHTPEYILEKARHIIRDKFAKGDKISKSTDAAKAIQVWLAPSEKEVFGALFLDSSHRILAFRELFLGTIDRSAVYPREIAKEALALNARAVILAHNHPSGDTTPSDQDIQITHLIQKALALIKVDVLDHLIVGRDVTSLREKGLI